LELTFSELRRFHLIEHRPFAVQQRDGPRHDVVAGDTFDMKLYRL
jgi:hypothetical protein